MAVQQMRTCQHKIITHLNQVPIIFILNRQKGGNKTADGFISKDIDPDDSYADLAAFRTGGKDCVLFAGGIIFNDRVPYLDTVAKQMPNLRFVLMCENLRNRKNVHNKFKEYFETNPSSVLEYFPVPNRMMRDNHEKNRAKTVSSEMSETIAGRSYLQENAENLRRRYGDMGDGYADHLVYWMYRYLSDVLDRIKPVAVIIWNEFHALNSILGGLCNERGIRTMYMEYGVLPGTFCLEQGGQMGESYPARHPAEFSALPCTDESMERAEKVWDYLYESRLNRKPQPKNDSLGRIMSLLDPSRRTVLYLGVNDYESGICPYTEQSKENHSPVFESSDAASEYLAELARKNGWNLVYKPHPIIARNTDIRMLDNGAVVASDVDLNELIDRCDAVVTILSQAGYVSTIRRKATVMLGYTQLYGKGITYEAVRLEDVGPTIASALENGFTEDMACRFLTHISQTSDYYLLDDQSNKRMSIGMSYKQCVKLIESAIDGKDQMDAMLAANAVGRYVGNDISAEKSLKEIRQFAEEQTRKIILSVGHICYDNETDYLYQIAKRLRDCRFVHLTLHYRAKYDRLYNADYVNYKNTDANDLRLIKFFIAPELFTKDHYPKHYNMEVTPEMKELMGSDEVVRNAALNLKLRHRDMGEGYSENFACGAYTYINDVLDALKPSVVIMWNKFHAFNSILDHVCRIKGIRTLYMEFGSLPGTYALEPLGQMGESTLARSSSEFMRLKVDQEDLDDAERKLEYLRTTSLSRRRQTEADLTDLVRRLDNGRPTILYAGQNDYESGLVPYSENSKRYHSPNFSSSRDALMHLAEMADRNGWNLVYKPHPIITQFSEETEYPKNVIAVDADINKLIDICDVTTTILSQVSYVSLIRGKPVVMLGYTQLKGKGCTYEAFDLKGMDGVFAKAIAEGYTDGQRSLFVHHVAQMIRYYLLDNPDDVKEITYTNKIGMAAAQVLMASDGYGNMFLPPEKEFIDFISKRSENDLIQTQDIIDVIGRNSVKVVSFDIFDTLLERPLIEPTDAFRLVGRRLGLEYDFPKYRDMAQRMAGQNKPEKHDSVTLEEIYRYFAVLTGEPEDHIETIKREEMQVERDYLYPRPLGQKLYRAAMDAGKEIIVVSDMYLPEDFLESVLKENGYTGYARLFDSCVSMRSKKTGRLYDYVLDSFGLRPIRPSNVLHIGDNMTADFVRAREHGLRAIHIPKASDLFKKVGPLGTLCKYVDKNMDNSFVLGLLANRIFEDPYFSYDRRTAYNGKAKNMGELVYGPLVMMFMKWLMDDLARDDKDEIYFLSRDGYLPQKVYNLFHEFYEGIPAGEEMYLNRSLMYCFCSYSPNGTVEADMRYPPSSKMRMEDYVRNRVYANDEQCAEIMGILSERGYGPDDPVKGLLNDYDTRMMLNKYFVANLRPRADALSEYYRERLGGRKVAIFDVGYRGRACRFLQDDLGYTVSEYHVISRPEVSSFITRGYDIRSFVDLSNLIIDRAEIAFILLDTILSVQETGIRCIEVDEDGSVSWTHEREDTFTETIRTIQDEALDVIVEMKGKFAKDWHLLHFDPYPIVDLMVDSLSKPAPKDAQIFKNQNTPNEPAFVDLARKNNISRWVAASSKSAPPAETKSAPAQESEKEPLPVESVSSALISILDRLHLTDLCRKLYDVFGRNVFEKR